MLIRRRIENEIRQHLKAREITLIVGPRQAGKTTLMRGLEKELQTGGSKTIWFNLDFEEDRQFFTSQKALLQRIRYVIGEAGYVFIDEIQRREDAGLFLKGLYDRESGYKWIVSGSGSLELKEKIGESLVGRKRVFELSTLTYSEYVQWREEYREGSEMLWKIYPEQANDYLTEYMEFGGYPRVATTPTVEEKRKVIGEIYQSYLEKDLIQLMRIEKSESLTRLIQILATQIGQLVNYTELSATLGISLATLKKYLWYMEKTYIIGKVTPYSSNKRKEITKAPIYYFMDLGMYQYAAGQFGISGQFGMRRDMYEGFLAQNFVYLQLREQVKNTASTIHYWRTRDGAEVDFVINAGTTLEPWEVKYKKLKRPEFTRSYRSFLANYQPKEGYVVSLGELNDERVGGATVHFVPFGGMRR